MYCTQPLEGGRLRSRRPAPLSALSRDAAILAFAFPATRCMFVLGDQEMQAAEALRTFG
jgi:hypothetical protein